ncbi:hypothetical protein [Dapis sp. BLCC M172]|uniref:hypothetical protein n=1 Tax=Dapis sp. BLCC M172 TaxID=2975281 RepID=UPI003CF7EFE8
MPEDGRFFYTELSGFDIKSDLINPISGIAQGRDEYKWDRQDACSYRPKNIEP